MKTERGRLTHLHKVFDDPEMGKQFLENPDAFLKSNGIELTDQQSAIIKNILTDRMAGKPGRIDIKSERINFKCGGNCHIDTGKGHVDCTW